MKEAELVSERPSESFTSGGFPKEANVLREASPLAASFGKLHLWRLDELVSERPSESFTSGGLMNLF